MSRYKPHLEIDALIFAANDVLIDVSFSYREVVKQTVQLYMERAIGLSPSKEPLITPAEVVLLQKVGHFTSYWDLATALVMYFVEMLPSIPPPTFPSSFHVPAILAYLQLAGGNLRLSVGSLRQQKDIGKLAADIAAAGGGIEGANKALPRENRHMLVASGDITKTNIVSRIFQELYLGADLFERVYSQQAILIQSTGYAEHESLIIDRDILAQLGQKVALAVVSDRPHSEVERSLKARNIHQYFQSIITLDDIARAGAKPIPNPWPLLAAINQLQPAPNNSAYVGANLGDIQAAKAANDTASVTAIGCLVGAHDKEFVRAEFEQNKAQIILGHPNHLKELILG